jgi:hypothetical protein
MARHPPEVMVVQARSRLRTLPLLHVGVGPLLALMCVVWFRKRWREPQPSQEEVGVHNHHPHPPLPLLHNVEVLWLRTGSGQEYEGISALEVMRKMPFLFLVIHMSNVIGSLFLTFPRVISLKPEMTLSGFANPAEPALRALSPSQLAFLEALPKAELHAHLNGSIPLPFLEQLAREYTQSEPTSNGITPLAPEVLAGVRRLQTHEGLDCIYDFFELFPAIHALTSTPANLKRATRAILSHFLDPDPDPDAGTGRGTVAYIELRTTPRETAHMTRQGYLETVLDEIEARPPDVAALIVCLDRAMTPQVAREVIDLTVQLRRDGRRVVGVDLCGDPRVCFVRISRCLRVQSR